MQHRIEAEKVDSELRVGDDEEGVHLVQVAQSSGAWRAVKYRLAVERTLLRHLSGWSGQSKQISSGLKSLTKRKLLFNLADGRPEELTFPIRTTWG